MSCSQQRLGALGDWSDGESLLVMEESEGGGDVADALGCEADLLQGGEAFLEVGVGLLRQCPQRPDGHVELFLGVRELAACHLLVRQAEALGRRTDVVTTIRERPLHA